MTGRPRKFVIQKDRVGLYHVWSRCVRQCYLCGKDKATGKDYSHRKQWIHDRLAELVQIFAVEACVYAILSNHYHLLVRNRVDLAGQWSDREVARRRWQLAGLEENPGTRQADSLNQVVPNKTVNVRTGNGL